MLKLNLYKIMLEKCFEESNALVKKGAKIDLDSLVREQGYPISYKTKEREEFNGWLQEKIKDFGKAKCEREDLIDFLLYFNSKKYQGATYSERFNIFDRHLKSCGYNSLCVLGNLQEFCALAALKFYSPMRHTGIYPLFASYYETFTRLQASEAYQVFDPKIFLNGHDIKKSSCL